MFLTKDNQIKWKKMGVAASITFVLVLLGIFWFDKPLFTFIRGFDCKLWRLFDVFFSAKMWFIVSFIAAALLCVKKYLKSEISGIRDLFVKTKSSHAFLIFCSVFCACGVVALLKPLIARLRPVLEVTQQIPEFNRFSWNWNSMPSGHTTVSFAGLVMIGMLAPRFKPLTWTLAILIGASRVIEGDHYLSDVILGAFIGMLVADVVKWWWLRKSK